MQITADILEVAQGGTCKTRIMHHGKLSFDLLQKYLEALITSGLLNRNSIEKTYAVTTKGLEFLKEYHEFEKLMKTAETKKQILEREIGTIENRYDSLALLHRKTSIT
jgi:predicted transcriptional regulator